MKWSERENAEEKNDGIERRTGEKQPNKQLNMFFDAVRNSKTQTEWDKESDYRERTLAPLAPHAPHARIHINSSKQRNEKNIT